MHYNAAMQELEIKDVVGALCMPLVASVPQAWNANTPTPVGGAERICSRFSVGGKFNPKLGSGVGQAIYM